jgi:hypothetical protein
VILRRAALALLLAATPVAAMTPEGREFAEILKQLEPVHCEKRKLRRQMAMAQIEKREGRREGAARALRKVDSEPKTARGSKSGSPSSSRASIQAKGCRATPRTSK